MRKQEVKYREWESGELNTASVKAGSVKTGSVKAESVKAGSGIRGVRGVEYGECESGNLLRVLWSAAEPCEGILDEEPAQQILRLLTDRLGESNLHHKEKNSFKSKVADLDPVVLRME